MFIGVTWCFVFLVVSDCIWKCVLFLVGPCCVVLFLVVSCLFLLVRVVSFCFVLFRVVSC